MIGSSKCGVWCWGLSDYGVSDGVRVCVVTLEPGSRRGLRVFAIVKGTVVGGWLVGSSR